MTENTPERNVANQDGTRSGTGNNFRRRNGGSKKNQKPSNVFKGETPGMNGKVFRLASEHAKKGEFKDTLEALERYAGRVYPLDAASLQSLFKKLEAPKLDEPTPPGYMFKREVVEGVEIEEVNETNEWAKIKYVEELKMYLKNQERLTATLVALYNVVWGQCSKKLQDRIKAEDTYARILQTTDTTELLKLIKIVTMKFEASVCLEESLWEAKHRFFSYRQADNETNSDHIRNVKTLHEVIEHYGGAVFADRCLSRSG